MAELAHDPSLAIPGSFEVDITREGYEPVPGVAREADVAVVSWQPVQGEPRCIWAGLRAPGMADYDLGAHFLLDGADTSVRFDTASQAGEYCLRFVPLATGRRGEAREVCFAIAEPRAIGWSAMQPPASNGGSTWEEVAAGAVAGVTAGAALAFLTTRIRRAP